MCVIELVPNRRSLEYTNVQKTGVAQRKLWSLLWLFACLRELIRYIKASHDNFFLDVIMSVSCIVPLLGTLGSNFIKFTVYNNSFYRQDLILAPW